MPTEIPGSVTRLMVPASMPWREAVARMDEEAQGILLVVDAAQQLLRTITDGDLRRTGKPADDHRRVALRANSVAAKNVARHAPTAHRAILHQRAGVQVARRDASRRTNADH